MTVDELLLQSQRNEITEYHVYRQLAEFADPGNAEVLRRIADEEMKHYAWFKAKTGRDVKPNRRKILKFKLAARLLGLTFAIKFMEYGEMDAQKTYRQIAQIHPDIESVIQDKVKH